MTRTTVIIPCYRDDQFLKEAIESIAQQTALPKRVVVVDDGSPIPLQQPEVSGDLDVIWVRTENRGLGAARNEGLRHAVGEFVAFLDADDHWKPEKLALQQARLDQCQSAVACYTECVNESDYFGFGPYPDPDLPRSELAAIVWQGQFFPPSSMLVRRDVAVKVGGFREGLSNGEDLDFLFRLFSEGDVVGVPHQLTFYRVHEGQITADTFRKIRGQKEAFRGVIKNHADVLRDAGLAESQYWDAYRDMVLLTYYRRNFQVARPMLWDYWRDHPCDLAVLKYSLLSLLPAGLIGRFADAEGSS